MRTLLALLIASLPLLPAPQRPTEIVYTVEYYYKVRWGHQDEFLQLFKKNHYPLLLKEKELGRILDVSAVRPRYHATEDGRWDYRITLVWKNAAAAHEAFPEAELRRLYPDQETFRREEQRRFEILIAHWDLPVVPLDLTKP